MSTPGAAEVEAAAEALVRALQAHLVAVVGRRGQADPGVHEAFHLLSEAFVDYDAVLYDVYDEVLPVEVVAYLDVEDDLEDDLEM